MTPQNPLSLPSLIPSASKTHVYCYNARHILGRCDTRGMLLDCRLSPEHLVSMFGCDSDQPVRLAA
jgi:hypothetical protein